MADRLVPLLICLAALGLRLWRLDELPLWVDESFTWHDYRQPLQQLLGARLNVHPPLYGLVMHLWMPVAGTSEYALRLPGALLSVLAVPAVWRLGVRLGGWPTGALAASLTATAPVGLAYAREARMYGPLVAEAALALLAADRLATGPSRGRWAGALLVVAAALLTHYAAAAAWAAAAARGLWTVGRARLAPWLAAQAVLAAVAGGWALHLWNNRDAWAGLVWLPWTPVTRFRHMALDWLSAMAGLPVGPNGLGERALDGEAGLRLALVAAFGLALLAGALLALRRDRRPLGVPLLLLALGPAVAIGALEVARPGWHIRFVLVGLPGVLLLAAVGATAARGRLWPVSALMAFGLLAGHLHGLAAPRPARDDWRAVAAHLRREANPGDVALGGVLPLASYYLGPVLPVRQRPVVIGRAPEAAAADLASAVGGARVVWVAPKADPLLDPADLVSALLGRRSTHREERVVGGVPLARFELRAGAEIVLGPPLRTIEARFGEAIRLRGYAVEPPGPGGASSVELSLDFQVERSVADDYKLFAHLLDADGRTVAQRDVVLVDDQRRTTAHMPPGTRVRVELSIEGPAGQVARGRSIGVGLYQLDPPGARLPVAPPAPEHRLVLPIDA